jgi:malate dehydrogenase
MLGVIGRKGGTMKKVAIVGSGNVGANTAFFIAEKGFADVSLSDALDGVAAGKALDIMEVAPLRSYKAVVGGLPPPEALEGADVVVAAAGAVRSPGMRREDLLDRNRPVVREISRLVKRLAPGSVAVVVTEPVDVLTSVFAEESGFPRERVLGAGGLLDSTRLRYAVGRDLGVSVETVSALVMGRHGPDLIAPVRFVSVTGVQLLELMGLDQFNALVEEVRSAGDFIVEMAQRGNAFYAPSAAIAELVDAVCRDGNRVLSVSVQLEGEYGIEGAAMSVPVIIGEGGVKRFLLPALEPDELARLKKSADDLRALRAGRKG